MKTQFIKVCILICICLGITMRVLSQETFTLSPPTIDGKNTETVWSKAVSRQLINNQTVGVTSNQAEFKLLWDYNNLYILVSVNDDVLYNPAADTTGDHVELYVDVDNSRGYSYDEDNDHMFYVAFGATKVIRHQNNPLWCEYSSVKVKSMQKPGNDYTYEISIPWKDVIRNSYFNPDVATIGIELRVIDKDGPSESKNALCWMNSIAPDETNKGVYVPNQFTRIDLRYGLPEFASSADVNRNIGMVCVLSAFDFGFTKNTKSPDFSKHVGDGYYLFSDYSNIIGSVLKDKDFTIQISTVGVATETYYGVWIDWNHNNVFEDDASEMRVVRGQGNQSVSFSIPSNAEMGETRMRVVSNSDRTPSSRTYFPGVTYKNDAGEVEDYSINVIASAVGVSSVNTLSSPCGAAKHPIIATVSNMTGDSIKKFQVRAVVTNPAGKIDTLRKVFNRTINNNGYGFDTVGTISTIIPGSYTVKVELPTLSAAKNSAKTVNVYTQTAQQLYSNYSIDFRQNDGKQEFWNSMMMDYRVGEGYFSGSLNGKVELISPRITLNNDKTTYLSFDYSLHPGDTLIVRLSRDCKTYIYPDTIIGTISGYGSYYKKLDKLSGDVTVKFIMIDGNASSFIHSFAIKTYHDIGVEEVFTKSRDCGNFKDSVFVVLRNFTDSSFVNPLVCLQARRSDGLLPKIDTIKYKKTYVLKKNDRDTVFFKTENTSLPDVYEFMAYTVFPDKNPANDKAYQTYVTTSPRTVPFEEPLNSSFMFSASETRYESIGQRFTVLPGSTMYFEYSMSSITADKTKATELSTEDSLILEISDDCSAHFKILSVLKTTGNAFDIVNGRVFLKIPIPAGYNNKSVNVRLKMVSTKDDYYDNWTIKLHRAFFSLSMYQDLALSGITTSGDDVLCGNSNDYIKLKVYNNGAEAVSSPKITVLYGDEYGYTSQKAIYTYKGDIASFRSVEVKIPNINTSLYSGEWKFKAFVSLANDVNHDNDTIVGYKYYPKEQSSPVSYSLNENSKNVLLVPASQWVKSANNISGVADTKNDTILMVSERIFGITNDQFITLDFNIETGKNKDSLGSGDKVELLYSESCSGTWVAIKENTKAVAYDSLNQLGSSGVYRLRTISANGFAGKKVFFALRVIRGARSSNSYVKLNIKRFEISRNSDIELLVLALTNETCGLMQDSAMVTIKNVGESAAVNVPVSFYVTHSDGVKIKDTTIVVASLKKSQQTVVKIFYRSSFPGAYSISASVNLRGDLNNENNSKYATKTTAVASQLVDKTRDWTQNSDGWQFENLSNSDLNNYCSVVLAPGGSANAQSPKYVAIPQNTRLVYSFLVKSDVQGRDYQLSYGDTIYVKYSENCGTTFKLLKIWTAKNLKDIVSEGWRTDTIDLVKIYGKEVIFKFEAKCSEVKGRLSDVFMFGLDNIQFFTPQSSVTIDRLFYRSNQCLSKNDSVFVVVRNSGTLPVSQFKVAMVTTTGNNSFTNKKDSIVKTRLEVGQIDTVCLTSPTKTETTYDYAVGVILGTDTLEKRSIWHRLDPKIDVPVWYENNWNISQWQTNGFKIASDGSNAVSDNKISDASVFWLQSGIFKAIPASSFAVFDYKIQAVDYDGYIANKFDGGDSILVQVSTDCGVKYSTLGFIPAASKLSNAFTTAPFPLKKFANQDVTIRILLKSAQWVVGDSISYYNVTIDNFRIVNHVDVKVKEVLRSNNSDCGSVSERVSAVIENNGTTDLTQFDIILDSYYKGSALNATVKKTYTNVLKAFQIDTVYLGNVNTSEEGQYELSVHIPLKNDSLQANNDNQLVFSVNTKKELYEQFTNLPPSWEYNNIELVNFHNEFLLKGRVSKNQAIATTHSYGPVKTVDTLNFEFSAYDVDDRNILSSSASVDVMVSTDCGQTFKTVKTINSKNYTDSTMLFQVALGVFANQNIIIRFAGKNATASAKPFAYMIDNVNISYVLPVLSLDLNDVYINNHDYLCGNTKDSLFASIYNNGNTIARDIVLKVEATGSISRDTIFSVKVDSIASQSTRKVFLGTFNTILNESYHFDVELQSHNIGEREHEDYYTGLMPIPFEERFSGTNTDDYKGWNISNMFLEDGYLSTRMMESSSKQSFTTPKIGVVGFSDALTFDYLVEGYDDNSNKIGEYLRKDDFVRIYVSEDCGLSWTTFDSLNVYNQNQPVGNRTYVRLLGKYEGKSIVFKIECSKGIVGKMHVSFDNMGVSTQSNLAISEVKTANNNHKVCGNANESVFVTVWNKGLIDVVNYKLETRMASVGSSSYQYDTMTVPDTLKVGSFRVIEVPGFVTKSNTSYTIDATVRYLKDKDFSDNYMTNSFSVIFKENLPYDVTFDNYVSTGDINNHYQSMLVPNVSDIYNGWYNGQRIENGSSMEFITPVIGTVDGFSRLYVSFNVTSYSLSDDVLGNYLHEGDSIVFYVSDECSNSFKKFYTISSRNISNHFRADLSRFVVEEKLSEYEGKEIVVKMLVKKGRIGKVKFDIDRFLVDGIDIGVSGVRAKLDGCGGSNDSLFVTVTNFGNGVITKFPVEISAYDRIIDTIQFEGMLAHGQSASFYAMKYDFTAPFVTISAKTINNRDVNYGNDAFLYVKNLYRSKVPFVSNNFSEWEMLNMTPVVEDKQNMYVKTHALYGSKQTVSRAKLISPVVLNSDTNTFVSFKLHIENSLYTNIINDEHVYVLATKNCGTEYDTLWRYDLSNRHYIRFDQDSVVLDLGKYAGQEFRLEFVSSKRISAGELKVKFWDIAVYRNRYKPAMRPTTPSELLCAGQKTSHSTLFYDNGDEPLVYEWKVIPEEAGQIVSFGNTCSIDWDATYSGKAEIFAGVGENINKIDFSDSIVVTIKQCVIEVTQPTKPSDVVCGGKKTIHSTTLINSGDSVVVYEWKLIPDSSGYIVNNGNVAEITWNKNYFGEAKIVAGVGKHTSSIFYSEPSVVVVDACINDVKYMSVNEVLVYPVPVSEELFVEMPANEAYYEIFNIVGEKIKSGKINRGGSISLDCVFSGAYSIKIITSDNIVVRSFVKK